MTSSANAAVKSTPNEPIPLPLSADGQLLLPPLNDQRPQAKDAHAVFRDALTPMMQQYWDLRVTVPDCLLFYRMGDFYELFFDDALAASKALDIALTRRGTVTLPDGTDPEIPMCGVPAHSYETYMARLIQAGFKVAIGEQIETPAEAKKRGRHKALVKRDIVRLVTPGTLTEEALLPARAANYLALVTQDEGEDGVYALAWCDLSTGDVAVQPHLDARGLGAALLRLDPREVVASNAIQNIIKSILSEHFQIPSKETSGNTSKAPSLTTLPDHRLSTEVTTPSLCQTYGVKTTQSLGDFSTAEHRALGGLVDYIAITQRGATPHLARPQRIIAQDVMAIDAATRRSLELTQTQEGKRSGSLLACLDACQTSAGARLLARWLAEPLMDLAKIDARLEQVAFLVAQTSLRDTLRRHLKSVPDLARALSRLSLGRGGPRDLAQLGKTLETVAHIRADIAPFLEKIPPELQTTLVPLADPNLPSLRDTLGSALTEELPLLARDGGFIADGFDAPLDELQILRRDSRKILANLQAKYAEKSKLNKLKIKHNNVLGYFIEVPQSQAEAALAFQHPDQPDTPFFTHRQTMASAMRFTTPELNDLARKIIEAGHKALQRELELFEQLRSQILTHAKPLSALAQALANLDLLANFAHIAQRRGYVRPTLDSGTELRIKNGRHPVVERALDKGGEQFISNDCTLNHHQDSQASGQLWLLTGPNMAGKSTFLRQNALIVLMAQIGCFVPADAAHIGLVDRLFSRVGAADNLARGQSTFMVEMVETASILNTATDRSFLILDEIGRGTATYDGLAIAWACVEDIHNRIGARTLFATHYHELTHLSERLSGLHNHHMHVREWQNKIVFTHKVQTGAAGRSYGIHVAEIAGLPHDVVSQARAILAKLEAHKAAHPDAHNMMPDLFDFAANQPQNQELSTSNPPELPASLGNLDPDSLTPREALDMLYKIKQDLERTN